MSNEWNPASTLPPLSTDVLAYSQKFDGFAVAVYKMNGPERFAWFNSTNGLPFPPNSISHWMELPEKPVASDIVDGWSGFRRAN